MCLISVPNQHGRQYGRHPVLLEGPFRSVYSVMDVWGSNHCVMTPGHVGVDFISVTKLRIPVYMHNLEENKLQTIYLVRIWNCRFRTAIFVRARTRSSLHELQIGRY